MQVVYRLLGHSVETSDISVAFCDKSASDHKRHSGGGGEGGLREHRPPHFSSVIILSFEQYLNQFKVTLVANKAEATFIMRFKCTNRQCSECTRMEIWVCNFPKDDKINYLCASVK